jgi:Copper transport outer membrane protein, MctB
LGYSARYHAASLVAVFLALAVGILIGAGLGDDLVSGTEENLRESLEGDIEQARGEADELSAELERERAFSSRAYPALVGDLLEGRRIGLLAYGGLSPELAANIEDALDPTGAELVEVAVVRRPPDVAALASELGPESAEKLEEGGPAELDRLGEVLGGQLALGRGRLLERIRDNLFSRSSGEGGRLQGVIITRDPLGDLEGDERANAEALETGLTTGVVDSGVTAVGVERSDASESSIGFFAPFEMATVDSVDLVSGRVALVFALLGADGAFGIKDSAGSLLPELLTPSPGEDGGP